MSVETMTIFKRSEGAQGAATMSRADLPGGRQVVLMRMGGGGLLSGTWEGHAVMLGMNAQGLGTNLYLTAEQAMALGAELLAMAGAMPGAMQGGVQ